MQERNLGRSGLRVSAVGLGCNNLGARIDDAAAKAVVHRALDAGITLFDTADHYGERGGSETVLGNLLGARRKDIILATKFGLQMDDEGWLKGTSRRYIMSAVEASLKRLKTDWIDLYQMHFPDPLTPIEETVRAMDDLVRQGKVRYIGCSNTPGWQVVDALWWSRTMGTEAFVSCQDEYSLVVRGVEKELIPAITGRGLGLLPYFPLASGLLTGKYTSRNDLPAGTRFAKIERFADKYMTPRNMEIVEKLNAFCAARDHTLLELAFSWLLAQPVVPSVIAGASRPEQIDANIAASQWQLTAEELAEIDQITKGA